MENLLAHLRNKFLAGVVAALPLAILAYGAWWIETNTKALTAPLGFHFPGLGVVLALAGVYLLGVAVTSFLGRWSLRLANWLLERAPGLNVLYRAWRDVLVMPPDKDGMFHQAVLAPVDASLHQLGFTNGRPLPDDPERQCVFLPGLPNPFSGRLVVVPRAGCVPLPMSVHDALKYHLSGGNFVPPGLKPI